MCYTNSATQLHKLCLRKGITLVKSVFSLLLVPLRKVAGLRGSNWENVLFRCVSHCRGALFILCPNYIFVWRDEERMKRKLSMLIAGVMMSSMILSGCSNNTSINSESNAAVDETGSSSQIEESNSSSESENISSSIAIPEFDTAQSIEETLLWDDGGISVTATELVYNSGSLELHLSIANNSGKDLTFSSGTMGYSRNAVNGYMVDDGYLSTDIANGSTSDEVLSFNTEQLMIYGITQVSDIFIGINAQDADGNATQLYPMQVKTSAYETYDYETDTFTETAKSGVLEALYNCSIDYISEEELYNQGDVRIISEALMTNMDGEQSVLLEIENDSTDGVFGITSDISVNDLMVYGYDWSIDPINPGMRRVVFISLSDLSDVNYRDIFGITDISQFDFVFKVNDANNAEKNTPTPITMVITDSPVAIDTSGEEVYNGDGVRIISKGVYNQESEYLNYTYPVFLVENNTSETITISDTYSSFLINETEFDSYILHETELQPGSSGLVYYSIDGDSLAENGITNIESIMASLSIKNADTYDTIAEPQINVTY